MADRKTKRQMNAEGARKGGAKIPQSVRARLVMGLFFVSALMVLLSTVYENIRMQDHAAMTHEAIQNHLLAAAKAAAGLVSVEELDKYHSVGDIDSPEYRDLKERLAGFAEEYQVLYVYYWRDYGDGRIQYIIDNDTDPENMYTPEVFFDIENEADPITAIAVPRILGGETWVSDLSSYTASGTGLISANAPVYRNGGEVYCAAGVDLGDEVVISQQRDARNIMIIQICALVVTVVCGMLNILFNWYKAHETDESRYTGGEHETAAAAGEKRKITAWFVNIATSGKYSKKNKFGMSDYLIRYVLMNIITVFGFLALMVFTVWNLAIGVYTDAVICAVLALVCPATFFVSRSKIPQIVPAMVLMVGYGMLCLLLVWNGDYQGYGIVFIYLYPVVTIMLLGLTYGVTMSTALVLIVSAELFIPGLSRFNYQTEIAARIVAAYLLIFFVPIIVETTRKTKDRLIADQNRRLLELKDAAEAASRTKSNFLANMSHEIRTPMNAIVGMSELLLRGELSAESKEYAADIKHASANLLSIINDLLDFSKIEAGRLEIIPVTYLLSSLVNDVVSIIRMRIMEKPIRFFTNIDSRLPNELFGDEVRVRQILLNLLGNAVKYTGRGFISVSITAENAPDGVEKEGTVRLRIAVSDSGIGIQPEDQPRLFGDFVQVDMKRNQGIEGTGLGLAITKRLCLAMGGDISLTSEYGSGSTFTALIPQEIRSATPFARVDKPEEKSVLVYEGRIVYAESIRWSLENLAVPYRLVRDINAFEESLLGEEWYYVFSGYGLFPQIQALLERSGKRPRLALLIEWGTESLIPGARFVSLPVQALSIAGVLNGTPDRRSYAEGAIGMETRFIAPRARLLVVDDIATNLKVAEGLIAPYKARVDTCLSGTEAIELVKRNQYDIVFMDHMMPEMDGVEAAAHIRAWEQEQIENAAASSGENASLSSAEGVWNPPRQVPIIALTANAVLGMRELFLSRGFNDFLAKPIDVSKLDEIMGKWLPKDKQQKAEIKREDAAYPPEADSPGILSTDSSGFLSADSSGFLSADSPGFLSADSPKILSTDSSEILSEASSNALPFIPGVDVKRGIAMTGGTTGGYRQVLAMFRKDAEERLRLLRETPGSEALPSFITQVHALKSAAASLGAAEVSAEAARLEAAGKNGDTVFIAESLPGFAERLEELVKGIRAVLNENAAAVEQSGRTEDGALLPLLNELAETLKAQKADAIDRVLEELARRPLDAETREALEHISDQALLAEFGAALETVNNLLNTRNRQ